MSSYYDQCEQAGYAIEDEADAEARFAWHLNEPTGAELDAMHEEMRAARMVTAQSFADSQGAVLKDWPDALVEEYLETGDLDLLAEYGDDGQPEPLPAEDDQPWSPETEICGPYGGEDVA